MVEVVERREIRATRWEIDLSGGTAIVPRKAPAGSMRVLSDIAPEASYLGFGELAVMALEEVSEQDRADARSL